MKGPDQTQTARTIDWIGVSLAALFALAQVRLIPLALRGRFTESAVAASGVLIGRPHWRVYQNRILGPWMVNILDLPVHDFSVSYSLYALILLFVCGWLAWGLGQALGRSRTTALAAFSLL